MAREYSEHFFDEMEAPNLASARAIIPLVVKLVSPKSAVDVGCGRGLWLKALIENSVSDVEGFDGDYVDTSSLVFPKEKFHAIDLERPITYTRTFDLAVCLEVAEHLPASAADTLVKSLVDAAPVVLFSAAIPLQGGSHHVNEQWPHYWQEKFAVHDYIPVDALRRRIWDNKQVSFFYAQNILIYVKESDLQNYPKLQAEVEQGNNAALPLVHPHMYLYYAERWRTVVPFLGKLPPSLLYGAKKLLNRFRRF